MKKVAEYTYEDYIKEMNDGEISYIEPMTCKEGNMEDLENLFKTSWVAQEKYDGHRAIMFVTKDGNRFFSRTDSKKTKWKTENTDKLPHLRDLFKSFIELDLKDTILDGEILAKSRDFEDVQSIMGSLEDKALKFQEENGYAEYYVFDMLKYKGEYITCLPYIERYILLLSVIENLKSDKHFEGKELPIKIAPLYVPINFKENILIRLKRMKKLYLLNNENIIFFTDEKSYEKILKGIWTEHKEGLVIKNPLSTYEQKRSKNFLKYKQHLTYDVVISGYEPPTKEYAGKTLTSKGYWDFWEDSETLKTFECRLSKEDADSMGYIPVTKPYCRGWIGAIKGGLYKDGELVDIVALKGLSDNDLEYIKSNKDYLIGTCIEVLAQGVMNEETKSLRHPRFSRWRTYDKNPKQCTWNSI